MGEGAAQADAMKGKTSRRRRPQAAGGSQWLLVFDASSAGPRHEIGVTSLEGLRDAVWTLITNCDGTLYLHPYGVKREYLALGVADGLALAHFDPLDPISTPREECRPYLWAASPGADGEDVTFNFGGTSTEIRRSWCIPIDQMIHIAEHYYEHTALPDDVVWEEDDA